MKCLRTPTPASASLFFPFSPPHGGALFPGDSKFERLAPNDKRGKIISHPIPPDQDPTDSTKALSIRSRQPCRPHGRLSSETAPPLLLRPAAGFFLSFLIVALVSHRRTPPSVVLIDAKYLLVSAVCSAGFSFTTSNLDNDGS